MSEIAQSPISNTGNEEWDKTFNECFWANMSTILWSHNCMFDGSLWVGKGEECSWCGAVEEHEVDPTYQRIDGLIRI